MSQKIHNLSAMELLALSKIKCPVNVRNSVDVCDKQEVDFFVHVHGHVTIQPDVQKPPTVSIPYLVVIALLAKRIPNVSRDKAVAMMMECMREALDMDKGTRDTILENYPELSDPEEGIRSLMRDLPPITQKGGVIPHLNIDLVEDEKDEKEAA